MEKNKIDVNNEIEAVINSLDHIQRAETPPFFYAKLDAKLQRRKVLVFDVFLQRMFNRPVIAAGLLSVFLVLNVLAIKGINKENATPGTNTLSPLQNFAAEYNLGTSTIYNNSGR